MQDDAIITKARRQTDRLNAHLIDKARGSSDNSFLASPVTGGDVAVGPPDCRGLRPRSDEDG